MKYLPEIDNAITALCRDDELMLREKLFLLGVVSDHIREVTNQLQDELAASERGLVH